MGRAIDLDKAIEIIEEKQKELCPVGRYGRNYVYGSDREKYDAWEEIIDALNALPTLPQPSNEALTGWVSVDERLPEDDPTIKKHIEMDKFGFLTVLVYNGTIKQTNRFFCNAPHFGLPKTDGWEWASMNVTHWMPLPEPPDRRPPERKEDT